MQVASEDPHPNKHKPEKPSQQGSWKEGVDAKEKGLSAASTDQLLAHS